MNFIYFLGAREQPRERQTRWIPLLILLGTTSDTPTLRMLTGKPCCIHWACVSLGPPRSKHHDGIRHARDSLRDMRMKNEGVREQESAGGALRPWCWSNTCERRRGKKEDWVGRASDRGTALRKPQPGQRESPSKACPSESPKSGRNASALVPCLWESMGWHERWADPKMQQLEAVGQLCTLKQAHSGKGSVLNY